MFEINEFGVVITAVSLPQSNHAVFMKVVRSESMSRRSLWLRFNDF